MDPKNLNFHDQFLKPGFQRKAQGLAALNPKLPFGPFLGIPSGERQKCVKKLSYDDHEMEKELFSNCPKTKENSQENIEASSLSLNHLVTFAEPSSNPTSSSGITSPGDHSKLLRSSPSPKNSTNHPYFFRNSERNFSVPCQFKKPEVLYDSKETKGTPKRDLAVCQLDFNSFSLHRKCDMPIFQPKAYKEDRNKTPEKRTTLDQSLECSARKERPRTNDRALKLCRSAMRTAQKPEKPKKEQVFTASKNNKNSTQSKMTPDHFIKMIYGDSTSKLDSLRPSSFKPLHNSQQKVFSRRHSQEDLLNHQPCSPEKPKEKRNHSPDKHQKGTRDQRTPQKCIQLQPFPTVSSTSIDPSKPLQAHPKHNKGPFEPKLENSATKAKKGPEQMTQGGFLRLDRSNSDVWELRENSMPLEELNLNDPQGYYCRGKNLFLKNLEPERTDDDSLCTPKLPSDQHSSEENFGSLSKENMPFFAKKNLGNCFRNLDSSCENTGSMFTPKKFNFDREQGSFGKKLDFSEDQKDKFVKKENPFQFGGPNAPGPFETKLKNSNLINWMDFSIPIKSISDLSNESEKQEKQSQSHSKKENTQEDHSMRAPHEAKTHPLISLRPMEDPSNGCFSDQNSIRSIAFMPFPSQQETQTPRGNFKENKRTPSTKTAGKEKDLVDCFNEPITVSEWNNPEANIASEGEDKEEEEDFLVKGNLSIDDLEAENQEMEMSFQETKTRFESDFKILGLIQKASSKNCLYRCQNRIDGLIYSVRVLEFPEHQFKPIELPLKRKGSFVIPSSNQIDCSSLKQIDMSPQKAQATPLTNEFSAFRELGNHPNIVRYFDIWLENSNLFVVSESCVKALDCGSTKVAESNLRSLLEQTVSGLFHLHKNNVRNIGITKSTFASLKLLSFSF